MNKPKTKRIKALGILRISIQLLFFILLPGLFISAFSGIRAFIVSISEGNFQIEKIWPQLVEAAALLPATLLLGRFFCGWMCAFGAFTDFLYHITGRRWKRAFRVPENVDRVLKYAKYILLAVLITAVWNLSLFSTETVNPWNVFGLLLTVGKKPDFTAVFPSLLPGFLLFLLILIGSIFTERFFCRYLCPLGAIFSLLSKPRIAKVSKPSQKCGKCRICTERCSMGIPLYRYDTVKTGECIQCFECVSACPRKNVSLNIRGDDIRPALAGTLTVAAMAGVYYAGTLAESLPVASASAQSVSSSVSSSASSSSSQASSSSPGESSSGSQSSSSAASASLHDGTYKGSGMGFRGETAVSVTVKGGKVTDIEVVSYNDDRQFFNRAFPVISQEILSNQSASVNAVSGATYSSQGIMQAVANALQNAKA